jgi:hypothetical protein
MPRQRRKYTPEFKVEAVKLVTQQGYSVAEPCVYFFWGVPVLPPPSIQ